MVTAILIPIICFYFFWLTKKEMREHDMKWLETEQVRHEAVLTGEIRSVSEEKLRFYYHRYIYVQELKIQTDSKLIKAKKITPLRKSTKVETFNVGDVIRIYGCWDNNHFHFNDYKIVS